MKSFSTTIVAVALLCVAQAVYHPPVLVPNNCPVCVQAPCPCDAMCPLLSCSQNCQEWKRDRRGCNKCQCAATFEKPGSCPKSAPGTVEICIVDCSSDAECEGSQKCCGGCRKVCTNPVLESPDTSTHSIPTQPPPCPNENFNWMPCRRPSCSIDSDCSHGKICCGRCRRRCVWAEDSII